VVLVDFYIASVKLALELDGQQHRLQKQYDQGGPMWLARKHGIKTVRFWNAQVVTGQAKIRMMEMLGMSLHVTHP